MISADINFASFKKQMDNLTAYANGFIDGAKMSKTKMLQNLGEELSVVIGQYIDGIASSNPAALHHVYEWGQTGMSSSRLFQLGYNVTGSGLSINSTMTQSRSVQSGSNVPFYNKASIMENGIPVKISPKNSKVLAFEDGGKTIFTKKDVVVSRPGGAVAGNFENTFNDVVTVYVSQAIFDITNVGLSLKNTSIFRDNIKSGVTGGRPVGLATGRKWITGDKI